MFLKSFLTTAFAGLALTSFAQQDAAHYCASVKKAHHPTTANKGTIADVREDNYDVKYVKLDVSMTNATSSISGNAITRARTTSAMTEYVTELTADLTVDSVKINGALRTFTHPGDVVSVTLAATIPTNTAFEAQVFYHGTIASGSSFFDRGLRTVYSGASLRNYTFTLGEPYRALDWWPCKQALQDKIDSSDVWITVPDSLKAGSNGLLKNITTISPTKKRYEWKSSNPIDYYLISASVGLYTDYSYYMHFANSSDSMLMQNYMYPNALPLRQLILDSTALMVNHFSDIFTRYPFWTEKYGHCQAPLSGGEEHQTMTTIGVWDNEVVPHELAHQWFGDHVTCGTWKDIWLNEGFASYAEYLFVEHFKTTAAAKTKIGNVHFNSMYDNPFASRYDSTGAVYVDDTTDENRIFSSRLTYNKASSIIHTLRFEANDDALFFNTLRLYQTQFANSTATTEQFKNLVAQQYGRNMDTFFNQWIYASGWPVYNPTWNQKNNMVVIRLNQRTTGDYTAHKYSTPIEIKFTSAQGDTTIRFQTNDNATTFYFPWTKTVTGVVVDPNDWLLDGMGVNTKDNTLSIQNLAQNNIHIFPNPVHDFLTIEGNEGTEILVTDITGKLLINKQLTSNNTVDMRPLAPGIYLYRTLKNGVVTSQGKVAKD